ncbi:MAG TPA: SRPBCC family protein [Gemmatimonadaceae bacterium]|nr:SRPBCC family protein [Gemmatimonadaceae bacterium]
MRTTLIVERPIAEVFEFCRDFENFPKIIDVLLSVEDSQDGRSHWAVRSPTGHSVEWNATVTKYVPNSVIAWESVPKSAVYASGLMRFAPLSNAETRLDLSLTYRPAETRFADALRALTVPTNSERLQAELARASQELSSRAAAPAQESSDTPEDSSVHSE